jgi:hypothetical protein
MFSDIIFLKKYIKKSSATMPVRGNEKLQFNARGIDTVISFSPEPSNIVFVSKFSCLFGINEKVFAFMIASKVCQKQF